MLKIFSFLLIIIGLYLINTIISVTSQNDECSQYNIGVSIQGQLTPLNYVCEIYYGQEFIAINLDVQPPSEYSRLVIDRLPERGGLYYDPYDESTQIIYRNIELHSKRY